jgi:6-methylpretetramide 4-monooxygenase / 4-hydroxy-6-methylpretetramide 12a-monooxygenase
MAKPGPRRFSQVEVLARVDVLDAVLAASVHLGSASVFDARACDRSASCRRARGLPLGFQCSLPQWRTDQILADRLMEPGGVMEGGVAVASVEPREDGVLVGSSEPTGRCRPWRRGGSSVPLARTASRGPPWPRLWRAGRTRAPRWRPTCASPAACHETSSNLAAGPEGYVLLAPLPDERWITFVGDLDDAEAQRVATATASGAVAAAIDRRVPGEVVVDDVVWAAPFRTHHRVVSRLAQGRRFLLGDAGHLPSPLGGEGLNSGLQDAHDIAWKLALVLRGRGRATLN